MVVLGWGQGDGEGIIVLYEEKKFEIISGKIESKRERERERMCVCVMYYGVMFCYNDDDDEEGGWVGKFRGILQFKNFFFF